MSIKDPTVKNAYFTFLEMVKLKFEGSSLVMCELFNLHCSFFWYFVKFSRHFKLEEVCDILFIPYKI